MSQEIKGYVRADQQEEFEAHQKSIREQNEKETNDYIKSVKKDNNGRIPMKSYSDQEFAFRNTNAFYNY